MITMLIRTTTGEFLEGGFYEPSRRRIGDLPTPDPDVVVVEIPGDLVPNVRLERYDERAPSKRRSGTKDEIAAWDAARPRRLNNTEIMRRITPEEHLGIATIARTDANVCKLMHMLLATPDPDVNSPESKAGWAVVKAAGVPSVWPDAAIAEQRVKEILA